MTTRTKANPLFVSALFILGPILLIGCFAWHLSTGVMGLTLNDFKEVILAKDWESNTYEVLMTLRLPNTLAITLAGAALAASAAMLQGLTRNRMAAPTTFGLTEMASLALLVTWPSMINIPNSSTVSIITAVSAITGCLIGCIILYIMFRMLKIPLTSIQLIFAGALMGTTAHFSSLLLRLYMGHTFDQDAIFISVLGHGIFKGESYALASLIVVALIGAMILSFFISKHYYQEKNAGVVVYSLSAIVVIVMTGMAVWLVGPVACVGFVTAVLLSKWFGNNYRIIIPGSAIIGAILLLLVSLLSKFLSPITDMPLAHTTNAVAIPLFMVMLWSHYRKTKM